MEEGFSAGVTRYPQDLGGAAEGVSKPEGMLLEMGMSMSTPTLDQPHQPMLLILLMLAMPWKCTRHT